MGIQIVQKTQLFYSRVTTYNRISIVETMECVNENAYILLTNLQVLTSDTVFSVPMSEIYDLLGVDAKDIITLEKYLQDYFTNILKKLKDLKAQSKQADFYI